MSRIIAIDYGTKRVGLAVTDPLQIIATALDTIRTHEVLDFLKEYTQKEQVEAFVIGLPLDLQQNQTDSTPHVKGFAKRLQKTFEGMPIHWVDERFTSKIAAQSMVLSGVKKKNRQVKANIDKISATLILQTFLEMQSNDLVSSTTT